MTAASFRRPAASRTRARAGMRARGGVAKAALQGVAVLPPRSPDPGPS